MGGGFEVEGARRHPLSECWGDMPDPEFRALVEDVRFHGVLTPITLASDGRTVLDGWHRCRAAQVAGVPRIPANTLSERADPFEFVVSANERRRHVSKAQRVAALELMDREAGRRSSRKRVAEAAGCSLPTVSAVRKYVERGHGPAIVAGDETVGSLRRRERSRLAKRDTVPPQSKMEKLEQQNADLRDERDALRDERDALRDRIAGCSTCAAEA